MPYKHIEKKIPRAIDKRVKLPIEVHQQIRNEYATGCTSQRKLAREYGVSRRLIQFILDPAKAERNSKAFQERQKTGIYYDKDKHRDYTLKHRRHKQELYLAGKLEEKNGSN